MTWRDPDTYAEVAVVTLIMLPVVGIVLGLVWAVRAYWLQ